MARDYTTTQMLTTLKKRAMVPSSQDTYQDSDLLSVLDDTIIDYVVPLIMDNREEFFVEKADTSIGSDSSFDIPVRAMGIVLRDILRVTSGGDVYSIARLEPEDLEYYNNASSYQKNVFYLENDKVYLLGSYNDSDSIRLKYYRRPNNLVAESACAKVSSVVGNVVSCESVPSTWTTADTFDVIKGSPHFRSLGDEQSATDVDTTADTITFTSAPSGIEAGDWICLTGTAPVAQIPYDAYSLLIEKASHTILTDLGDLEGAQVKERLVKQKEDSLVSLVSNRTKGENRKIINRQNMSWKRGWYWGY